MFNFHLVEIACPNCVVPFLKDTDLEQNGAFGAEYYNFQPPEMEGDGAGDEILVRCISTECCVCGGAAPEPEGLSLARTRVCWGCSCPVSP